MRPKIAGVQMDVAIGDVPGNLHRIIERFTEACAAGAQLVIFPECAVTGYCFDSREEAWGYAETIPGPAVGELAAACRHHAARMIVGMLERDGSALYNVAVLIQSDGAIEAYRKVHLPWLGVDRFTDFGNAPFRVQEAGTIRVGMNICYDSAFPEASRSLTLQGADLIALPTNWPPGAEGMAEHAVNVRAMENAVYYAAINRVGTERGVPFIGRSRIADPLGRTVASASPDGEEILYAELELERARNKRIVRRPDAHVIDRMADRRPEFYGVLTERHELPRPGRD